MHTRLKRAQLMCRWNVSLPISLSIDQFQQMIVGELTMHPIGNTNGMEGGRSRDDDAIERWWSAQGRSSLRKEKEICSVTSVVWQATEGTMVLGTLL